MTRTRLRMTTQGLTLHRYLTGAGKGAIPAISWVTRCGTVHAAGGETVGRSMCEVPSDWSQLAVDTAVSRYFTHGRDLVQPRTSIRDLVGRVTEAITDCGRENGIFRTIRDADNYRAELTSACLRRYGWFSESVWRNISTSCRCAGRSARQAAKAASRPQFEFQKPVYLPIHASDHLMRDREQLRIVARKVCECGAATIHFDDAIAAWHTCPASGPVAGLTPSTSYLFLNNSTCKVATINVNRFLDKKGQLDIAGLRHVVTLFTIALDILVDRSDYADRITDRISRAHRPIGVSYAGLAPLLMRLGIPYDSDWGRAYAATLTSFITATVCATSQRLAVATEPFSEYAANQASVLAVIRQHTEAAAAIRVPASGKALHAAAKRIWAEVADSASATGFRNAQFTLLAAAGIGGLILDCDASDLGPMFSLVKYSRTAEEEIERQVHPCVEQSLGTLGYTAAERSAILAHILDKETIEGAPGLKPKHLPIFDCQFPSRHGGLRALSAEAQMKMMAAVQSSLSGCTQRSLNLPSPVRPDQLATLIKDAWDLGMRTLDIYCSGGAR